MSREPEIVSALEALLYAIAMIAGGIGGAGAVALAVVRGRPVTGIYVVAYMILGAVAGGILAGLDYWTLAGLFGERVAGVFATGPILGRAMLAGFTMTATLAGLNLGIAKLFARAGVRIVLQQDDPEAPKRRATDRQP